MTLYDIKPEFQSLLRPLVKLLYSAGISANQITLAAMSGSFVISALLIIYSHIAVVFLALPVWMLVRMALNAIDGMLAREFSQQSKLGAYLNEICDVLSDAALFIPFAMIMPFSILSVGLVVFLSMLSEFAGVLGQSVGASRRYDGPMGKSDRALVFGALGLWIAIGGALPAWLYWIMPMISILLVVTIINRIKRALVEAQ